MREACLIGATRDSDEGGLRAEEKVSDIDGKLPEYTGKDPPTAKESM